MSYGSALVELADTLEAHNTSAPAAAHELRISERTLLELTNVRGDRRSPEFVAAIERAFGVELPGMPNTVTTGATHSAWWLGPDEWLLQSTEPRLAASALMLRPLFEQQFASAVDVSSGYTVLELRGGRVREVLQKGCPLDLHPRVFQIGRCAQSHFFKAGVILRPVAAEVYEFIVRRSFADYAVRMLLDRAQSR